MTSASSDRQTGIVKWFNTKSGYGFLTPVPSTGSEDIFVHHSELVCNEDQFRYLVQGEYVEFIVTCTDDNRTTASDVTGIARGALMCETRHERSKEGENAEGENGTQERRYRGGGPRGGGSRPHQKAREAGRKPQLVVQTSSSTES